MPKGVMWRSDDLLLVLNDGAPRARKLTEDVDLDHLRRAVSSPGIRTLPACPLMHGTGAFNAFTAPTVGGSVVPLTKPSFDTSEALAAVQGTQVTKPAHQGQDRQRVLSGKK